jgi:hypothetical protein
MGRLAVGNPIDLHFSVLEHGRPVRALSVSAEDFCPATPIQLLYKQWKKEMRLPSSQTTDRSRKELVRAQAVRAHLRLTTEQDPVQYVSKSVYLVHPKLAHAPSGSMAIRTPTSKTIDGTSHPNAIVRLRINIVLPFTTTTKRVWQGRRVMLQISSFLI